MIPALSADNSPPVTVDSLQLASGMPIVHKVRLEYHPIKRADITTALVVSDGARIHVFPEDASPAEIKKVGSVLGKMQVLVMDTSTIGLPQVELPEPSHPNQQLMWPDDAPTIIANPVINTENMGLSDPIPDDLRHLHPDGFPGTDEGSHFMSQTDLSKYAEGRMRDIGEDQAREPK